MKGTSYFLGVDGGQSATTALVGDETGRIVAFGAGGPCNHVGAEGGREKFIRAIRESLSNAGFPVERTRFTAACLGFSGGPADKEAILREILSAETLLTTTDYAIALSGASGGAPGIITIAGTGSIAFGRNAEGRTARAGGWGYVFGDEGAGFDIVRHALRTALRFEEGWGPPTGLLEMLLAETGAPSANDLAHRFYTAEYPRQRIAAFSKLVDRAANEGDAVARTILENAGRALAELAAAVREQLFNPGEIVTVAYIGGVFRSTLLLERFRALIELHEGVRCAAPVHGPAAGALIEAYRAAGLAPALTDLPDSEK